MGGPKVPGSLNAHNKLPKFSATSRLKATSTLQSSPKSKTASKIQASLKKKNYQGSFKVNLASSSTTRSSCDVVAADTSFVPLGRATRVLPRRGGSLRYRDTERPARERGFGRGRGRLGVVGVVVLADLHDCGTIIRFHCLLTFGCFGSVGGLSVENVFSLFTYPVVGCSGGGGGCCRAISKR